MPPSFSQHDRAHGLLGYPKLSTKLTLAYSRSMPVPYKGHAVGSEFRVRVFLPQSLHFRVQVGPVVSLCDAPASAVSILRIFFGRPLSQMVRIAADRIITRMEHEEIRQAGRFQVGGNPVGFDIAVSQPKNTVPIAIPASHPRPALMCEPSVYLAPEPFDIPSGQTRNWFTLVHSHAVSFVDRLVRAVRVRQHSLGSFYFTAPGVSA